MNEQEKFWAGAFGNQYINRNIDDKIVSSNIALFSRILSRTNKINSILEFGSNIGLNLVAIHTLKKDVEISAIEINQKAVEFIEENFDFINCYHSSVFDFHVDYQRDLVFTKGLLIHIHPENLEKMYSALYESSNKYICLIEYYDPNPKEIEYRGENGVLWKRDFAGEIMKKYPSLELIDYGFIYHGDNQFPADDLTWFLMKKC